MNIVYTLKLEDYIEFNGAFVNRYPKLKLWVWLNYFGPMVPAALISLAFSGLSVAIVVYIVLTSIWCPICWYLIHHRVRRVFRRDNLHLARSTSLGPHGITTITPESNSTLRWSAIADVYDDQSCIYFLTPNRKGLFVPKSAFESSSAAAEFLLNAQSLWYQHRGGSVDL